MAIGVKVMKRPDKQVSYVRATLKGMALTFKHMLEKKVTMQYPEQKSTDREHGLGTYALSPRWRGTHRMLTDEQGRKCFQPQGWERRGPFLRPCADALTQLRSRARAACTGPGRGDVVAPRGAFFSTLIGVSNDGNEESCCQAQGPGQERGRGQEACRQEVLGQEAGHEEDGG